MIYSLKHWQKLAIALAGMETHGVKTTTIAEQRNNTVRRTDEGVAHKDVGALLES